MHATTATRKCLLFLLFLFTTAGQACAAEPEHRPLKLTLCAEYTTIVPGQTFTVGLLLQHQPNHHSYFKFPGIVGVGTKIEWTLPKGYIASEIQWPVPQRVDMRGHDAYGYRKDTLLLVDVTPPAAVPPKDNPARIELQACVGYMCCSQERCTPGFEDLTLTINVSNTPVAHPTWPAHFDATRQAHAKTFSNWNARVETEEDAFHLHLTAPRGLKPEDLPKPEHLYFFSTNHWTASNEPHRCEHNGRDYHFSLPKHPFPDENATRFQGILRNTEGWNKHTTGMLIDLPLITRQPQDHEGIVPR